MLSNGNSSIVEIVISSGSGSPVEVRCPDCARLLFKADIPLGVISISITTVCPRCKVPVRWPDLQKARSGPRSAYTALAVAPGGSVGGV